MNDAIRMQISAYVDGELPENEAELLLRRMTQDIELRREVAEFLAMSRLIRDRAGLAATDRLHERVLAEIDERPTVEQHEPSQSTGSRWLRPLVGVAVAASVALVAIVGLQQADVPGETAPATADLAEVAVAVPSPEPQQELQRQYFLNHADASSDLGANGINSRLVTLRFSEDVVADSEEELNDADLADTEAQPDSEPQEVPE